MTWKEKLRLVVVVVGEHLLDPPGWIPAWVTCGLFLLSGQALLTAAVQGVIEIPRLQFALECYKVMASTYQGTLGLWLGYKGITAGFGAWEAIRRATVSMLSSKIDPGASVPGPRP